MKSYVKVVKRNVVQICQGFDWHHVNPASIAVKVRLTQFADNLLHRARKDSRTMGLCKSNRLGLRVSKRLFILRS